MSKKIIYLLSLLMALSLVFASCKKNGLAPGDIGGGIENEDNSGKTGATGLYENFADIPTDAKPLITYKVFNLNGTETFRNSVMVPMGTKTNYIAVFSENRYTSTTADNDIALDGETITDIVYNLNTQAGKDGKWIGEKVVGGTKAQNVSESHAAIVVFKVADNKVVIVASQGAGISRVDTDYDSRKWNSNIPTVGGQALKSNLQFIVGTLNEDNNEFNWTTWKDIKVDGSALSAKIEDMNIKSANSTDTFKQFGTHSARGVTDGTKVYVPIVLAVQGYTGSAAKELMGNIILTADFNESDDPTWSLKESTTAVAFDAIGGTYPNRSKQKESIIYDVSSSQVKYLTVPSGSADSTDQYLFFGTVGSSKPQNTGIKAGDGSPGLVKLAWKGKQEYNVAQYANDNKTPNSMLLMHVQDTERNLYINLIEKTDFTANSTAAKKVFVNTYGKSSSVDVLPDGTIITLAEEGLSSGTANERKYNVVFKRYSQAYLASILK